MRPQFLITFGAIATAAIALHGSQASTPQGARDGSKDGAAPAHWDVTQPRGKTREISFTTSEGTWMSVDLSPDGSTIVFDLLGHIYRLPSSGGQAECLTQSSGVAINTHPRWSPDGKTIAFISDRQGQMNLWLMDADGSNPRAVVSNQDVRAAEPAWTPDGRFILVRRQDVKPGGGGGSGIWMYAREGGEGIELVGREPHGASWPSVSSDGRHVYFHINTAGSETWSGRADVMQGGKQIRRLDIQTGNLIEVTSGESLQQGQTSSGGGLAPEISPDGRWLAFARRIPDGTISYRGLKFGPRTALWLRDLHTGAERLLMDPIDVDMAEGMKVLRDLPGYSWARDGASIVIAQGGKLRRVDVASGAVTTIPFTARVQRTISEMAGTPQELSSDTFTVKYPRWTTSSPDGRRLAFQAVGHIWVMDLPASTPRRLTPDSFEPFEMSPAWSPDSKTIAFVSWADRDLGQVWTMPVDGGASPRQITTVSGEYLNTIWSPDGRTIVVTRGAGATLQGRTVASNQYYELVKVPAAGGATQTIATVNRPYQAGRPLMPRRPILQAHFGPEGRLFYPETFGPDKSHTESRTEVASIDLDGRDRRVHVVLPHADEAAVSPDGKWLAFEEGDNVFLMAFPLMGTGATPVQIDKRKGRLPVTPLSREGGAFPRWRDARTAEFVSGPRYYTYDVETKEANETPIALTRPRAIAKGSIAFTNARLITMEQRRVIDRGTLIVKDGRITCVGPCSTAGVDRVIDAKGQTIMPGLIDMHAHHHRDHEGVLPKKNWESAIYLAYGVTTTMDNSMWSGHVFPQAELVESGEVLGPRSFSTGDPLYSGDGARQNEITSYEAAEQNVARLQAWGAITLKQYGQPRRDQRQWITDAARKRGLRVTAEGGDLEYNLSMIMDGHTGWEHPLSYVPIYDDVARFFGLAKATYSVTFLVGGPGPWNEEYFFQQSDVWGDEKLRRFTPWRMLIPGTRRRMLRPESDYSFPLLARGLADIVAHGGYGAIGSHGQQHGLGSHWETWAAASAMGPMGALEVATLHGAAFLGLERELGSLTVGKLADVIVLTKNPLDDIHNTTSLRYVVKNGTVWDASTLDQVWPVAKPYGDYPWVNPDALRSDDRRIGQ
jgi:Tol biopolymer transport system component